MITLGLVHINDIVVSTYEIHSMLVACYRLVPDYLTTCIFHVTGVGTWWLYHLDNCMLRIGTIIFLIVTVNMEDHIIVLIYLDFVFQTLIVSAEFGSSRVCWVICSLNFYPCQRISWGCGLHNLLSLAVASWTWTWTYICGFVDCSLSI